MNKPVTIISRSDSEEEDDYGNALPGEVATTTLCDLQQRQRSEPGDAGEFSITEWVLFLPSGTAIDTGDAVLVGGEKYEVVGDPWDAVQELSPSLPHVEATVKRTAGEASGS